MDKLPVRHDDGPARRARNVDGPTHRSFARLESNGSPCRTVDIRMSPLAACPQEVKDGVEDGTKVGGARSPARSRRRQNRRNKSPRRVSQVGVVESSAHRTVPLARISALSRQTSTFQTPSKTQWNWRQRRVLRSMETPSRRSWPISSPTLNFSISFFPALFD